MTDSTLNRFLASGTAGSADSLHALAADTGKRPERRLLLVRDRHRRWLVVERQRVDQAQGRAGLEATVPRKDDRGARCEHLRQRTSGVGATLTGNANGALAAQDGVTLVAETACSSPMRPRARTTASTSSLRSARRNAVYPDPHDRRGQRRRAGQRHGQDQRRHRRGRSGMAMHDQRHDHGRHDGSGMGAGWRVWRLLHRRFNDRATDRDGQRQGIDSGQRCGALGARG
jgi:hypothetical protein